jgi:hypothetical protein
MSTVETSVTCRPDDVGNDEDDDRIHIAIPGVEPKRSYCGLDLSGPEHSVIPDVEVPDSEWCNECEILDRAASM